MAHEDLIAEMRKDQITIGALQHYTLAEDRHGPWTVAAVVSVNVDDVVSYHRRLYRITRTERRGVLLELHGEFVGPDPWAR